MWGPCGDETLGTVAGSPYVSYPEDRIAHAHTNTVELGILSKMVGAAPGPAPGGNARFC